MNPKLFTEPVGMQQHSSYPWANRKQQGVGLSACNPRLQLRDFMPSPTSSNFWVMRQQKTMTLARVLQAFAKELGFLTGVLCDAVWELQRCMAPLLAFSSDEVVEASLLRPRGEECRTSPTPEEEGTLLGKIKYGIKCWIKLPQNN